MHIAHVGRADVVQRAGLRGHHVAPVDRADAERPHAQRVARRHQAAGREQDDRVSGFNAVHQRREARFPAAVLVQQIAPQDLGVGRGREAVAALGQLRPNFGGVDHVAVMRNAHSPPVAGILEQDRLRVAEAARPGRRVARVPDRRNAVQRPQLVLGEDLRDEPHPGLQFQRLPVGGADARALLPPVLQGVDAVKRQPRHINSRRPDAKDAASFAGRVGKRRHTRLRSVGRRLGMQVYSSWSPGHRVMPVRRMCRVRHPVERGGAQPSGSGFRRRAGRPRGPAPSRPG